MIFGDGALTGGSALTARVAREAGKPCLHLDVKQLGRKAEGRLRAWITEHDIRTLNVAGSRESLAPGIRKAVATFLEAALSEARAAYVTEDEALGLDTPAELAVAEAPPKYRAARRRSKRPQP